MSNRYSSVELVWFDPGVTTGCIALSIDAGWLTGDFPPDWEDLGACVQWRRPSQTGRLRAYLDKEDRLVRLDEKHVDEGAFTPWCGPIESIVEREERLNIKDAFHVLKDFKQAAWGYEDFVPRELNKTRVFLAPVRVFSGLLALEDFAGNGRKAFCQTPSLAMRTATDERLKSAGLYFPGMPHATDAARHACTFLRTARKEPEVRGRAWPHTFTPEGKLK